MEQQHSMTRYLSTNTGSGFPGDAIVPCILNQVPGILQRHGHITHLTKASTYIGHGVNDGNQK